MMQDSIYLQLEDEYCPYSGVDVLHCKLLMKAVMKERQKKIWKKERMLKVKKIVLNII